MRIHPFTIPPYTQELQDLRDRLARTRWPDTILNSGWTYGFNLNELQRICHYWRDEFDWRREVAALSELRHFRFESVDGGIHFVHVRGRAPNAVPLLLLHGWPGSFLEMLKLVPLLPDFDLVLPSLPGFGFSDRPTRPGMNTARMAELFVDLMRELGYERFAAHGGDFGAGVATFLGLRHPEHTLGIHLNYVPGSYRPWVAPGEELRQEEAQFLRDDEQWMEEWGAYLHLQARTPQTLAYGLNDSPAGLAAWILEKFRDWADCEGEMERCFCLDELLANVTLYWLTQTIHSSCRLYFERSRASLQLKEGQRVDVPVGIAHFPKEAPFPPRRWIERGYNVTHWTDMPRGGHFAAMEQPKLLAEDIRKFLQACGAGTRAFL